MIILCCYQYSRTHVGKKWNCSLSTQFLNYIRQISLPWQPSWWQCALGRHKCRPPAKWHQNSSNSLRVHKCNRQTPNKGASSCKWNHFHYWWLGGSAVMTLNTRPKGPRFNSQPVHYQVITLGKWFTPMQTASAFSQQSPTFRATSSTQHLRPSGVFCCRTNCLELTAWWPTWSGMFCRHLQTVAKDVFVFKVLVCFSALKVLTLMRYTNLHLTFDIWLYLFCHCTVKHFQCRCCREQWHETSELWQVEGRWHILTLFCWRLCLQTRSCMCN